MTAIHSIQAQSTVNIINPPIKEVEPQMLGALVVKQALGQGDLQDEFKKISFADLTNEKEQKILSQFTDDKICISGHRLLFDSCHSREKVRDLSKKAIDLYLADAHIEKVITEMQEKPNKLQKISGKTYEVYATIYHSKNSSKCGFVSARSEMANMIAHEKMRLKEQALEAANPKDKKSKGKKK